LNHCIKALAIQPGWATNWRLTWAVEALEQVEQSIGLVRKELMGLSSNRIGLLGVTL
jgi:hypothetical protein